MAVELAELIATLVARAVPEAGTERLRLPTERDLVVSLGTSRGTLREQLSMLEMLGFLDRTQGRGSYLQVPDAGFIRLYFDLSAQLGQLGDDQVRTAREMIELSTAEAAARRATPEDVADLRALVDDMVAASAAGDDTGALEADLAFHRRLGRIVDNPVVVILQDGLSHALRNEVLARRRMVAEQFPGSPRARVIDDVHYGIVDAVATGDPDAARAAMRRHFQVWSDLLGEGADPSEVVPVD